MDLSLDTAQTGGLSTGPGANVGVIVGKLNGLHGTL